MHTNRKHDKTETCYPLTHPPKDKQAWDLLLKRLLSVFYIISVTFSHFWVCVVCMCVLMLVGGAWAYACGCVIVSVKAWSCCKESSSRWFFHLIQWSRALHKTQSSTIWQASGKDKLAGITGSQDAHLVFSWVLDIWILVLTAVWQYEQYLQSQIVFWR